MFTNDDPINLEDPEGLMITKVGGITDTNAAAVSQAMDWGRVLALDSLVATYASIASEAALAADNTHSASIADEAELVAYAAAGAARYYASQAQSYENQYNAITVDLFAPAKSIQGITSVAIGDAQSAHSSAVSTYNSAKALDGGFTFHQIFSSTTLSNIGTVALGCAFGVGTTAALSGGFGELLPWQDVAACTVGAVQAYQS